LIEVLASEIEKDDEEQDKTIINQLSKTIAERSKILAEFSVVPPDVITYKKYNLDKLFQ